MLRGGAQPRGGPPANTTANATANASQPSAQSKGPTPSRRQAKTTRDAFGVRDAITASLGLLAAVAVQWVCNANLMAKIVATVHPERSVRQAVWVLFSGALAAAIFLLVRVTNAPRAIVINRVLSKLVLNRESQSTLPSLALVFLLGVVAAIKALPAYDLRLLWAMLSSLGLVVGAAAIKFGGKRPSLGELVNWAWDSLSASLS